MRWPLHPVLIQGPSMVPTLRPGDLVLTWQGWRAGSGPPVRPGDVVLARFRSRPDLLVVKRAVRRIGDGWWLAGDNPYGSDDSVRYGVADVVARVVWRYWPLSQVGRIPPPPGPTPWG